MSCARGWKGFTNDHVDTIVKLIDRNYLPVPRNTDTGSEPPWNSIPWDEGSTEITWENDRQEEIELSHQRVRAIYDSYDPYSRGSEVAPQPPDEDGADKGDGSTSEPGSLYAAIASLRSGPGLQDANMEKANAEAMVTAAREVRAGLHHISKARFSEGEYVVTDSQIVHMTRRYYTLLGRLTDVGNPGARTNIPVPVDMDFFSTIRTLDRRNKRRRDRRRQRKLTSANQLIGSSEDSEDSLYDSHDDSPGSRRRVDAGELGGFEQGDRFGEPSPPLHAQATEMEQSATEQSPAEEGSTPTNVRPVPGSSASPISSADAALELASMLTVS